MLQGFINVKFMKIFPLEAEWFMGGAEGRTELTKLTGAIGSFTNAPKGDSNFQFK
jgi:hypothetical protein